jgi:hypothetical protein
MTLLSCFLLYLPVRLSETYRCSSFSFDLVCDFGGYWKVYYVYCFMFRGLPYLVRSSTSSTRLSRAVFGLLRPFAQAPAGAALPGPGYSSALQIARGRGSKPRPLPRSVALAESWIGAWASRPAPDRIEPRIRSWAEGKVTPAVSPGSFNLWVPSAKCYFSVHPFFMPVF